jgi:hypothetical protein
MSPHAHILSLPCGRAQASPEAARPTFDTAHFAFVHAGTFGQGEQPRPKHFALDETAYGFEARVELEINNPPASQRITGTTDPVTTRTFSNQWHLPFLRKLGLAYPSGVQHTIYTCTTPIDGWTRIQPVQENTAC